MVLELNLIALMFIARSEYYRQAVNVIICRNYVTFHKQKFAMERPTRLIRENLFFKNGQHQPLFVNFRSFQVIYDLKLLSSNLDRQNRRRARWPLDHHHFFIRCCTLYTYLHMFCNDLWKHLESLSKPTYFPIVLKLSYNEIF